MRDALVVVDARALSRVGERVSLRVLSTGEKKYKMMKDKARTRDTGTTGMRGGVKVKCAEFL